MFRDARNASQVYKRQITLQCSVRLSMKHLIRLLDSFESQRRWLRWVLFCLASLVFLASMTADLAEYALEPTRSIDAASVALLLGLLWARQNTNLSTPLVGAACRAIMLLSCTSLVALFAINLGHASATLSAAKHLIIDPEIALTTAIGARAILKEDREPQFMLLSRQAIYVIIPAFGILSTVTGIADGLQGQAWQPTTGINLTLAALLLLNAILEFSGMSQSRNASMVGIALPLPAISYFILSDLFTNASEGATASLVLNLVIMTTLILGARFLTGAVDVFFTMAENAEKRSVMLARQNTVIQDLVYALAHDLRSPARGIVQTSEWLREDLRDRDYEQLETRTELISERAQALYERLDAFVEYVRLGRFVAKRQTVALDLLAANLVDAMPHDAKKIITLHGHELTIQTDESALASILSNLLENAAIYADQEAPEVHLSWGTEGNDLLISVYNNGPTIREAAIPKIFQPFRGNVSNTVQNGMALAITARLVEALGGKISVFPDQTTGMGTEFRCAIPLRRSPA